MDVIADKNQKLAELHWGYLEKLLFISMAETAYDKRHVLAMCKFHYLTAWEHGAKHMAELLDGGGEKH